MTLLFLAILAALMFVCVYWIFEPPIITISNVRTNKLTYAPGDRISYSFQYCKRKDGAVTIYRSLADTFRIPYSPIKSAISTGCGTVTRNDLIIPDFIKPDGRAYHLEATIEYQLNPLRKNDIYWESNQFNVE